MTKGIHISEIGKWIVLDVMRAVVIAWEVIQPLVRSNF
jgi:hypothetical protein